MELLAKGFRAVVEIVEDEEGAQIMEAILLLVLIAIGAMAGLQFLSGTASNKMNNIGATTAS
jgi:Flp pilus assembly pilin Flp